VFFSHNELPSTITHSEIQLTPEERALEEEADAEFGDAKCMDLSLLPSCFSCLWCLRAYLICFLVWAAGIVVVHYSLQTQLTTETLSKWEQLKSQIYDMLHWNPHTGTQTVQKHDHLLIPKTIV